MLDISCKILPAKSCFSSRLSVFCLWDGKDKPGEEGEGEKAEVVEVQSCKRAVLTVMAVCCALGWKSCTCSACPSVSSHLLLCTHHHGHSPLLYCATPAFCAAVHELMSLGFMAGCFVFKLFYSSVMWVMSTFSPVSSLSSNGMRMRVCVCACVYTLA